MKAKHLSAGLAVITLVGLVFVMGSLGVTPNDNRREVEEAPSSLSELVPITIAGMYLDDTVMVQICIVYAKQTADGESEPLANATQVFGIKPQMEGKPLTFFLSPPKWADKWTLTYRIYKRSGNTKWSVPLEGVKDGI